MKQQINVLLVALLTCSGLALQVKAQSPPAPRPDMSLAESRTISPFPPKKVQVEVTDGRAMVKWTMVPSEKIVGYDIFRSVDDGPLKKIGHAKESPFTDEKPAKGKVNYAVASVDYNDNRSKPRLAETK